VKIAADHMNSVSILQEGVEISDGHTNSLSLVSEIPDSLCKSLLYSFSDIYFLDSTIHDRFFIKKSGRYPKTVSIAMAFLDFPNSGSGSEQNLFEVMFSL
jgi:hypothetical protein